jgi:hypothetical protein
MSFLYEFVGMACAFKEREIAFTPERNVRHELSVTSEIVIA